MIFSSFYLNQSEPIYIQIKNYIIEQIQKGVLLTGSKLPSSRELSQLLKVSRNSVVAAYEELESEGVLYSEKGKGTFVRESEAVDAPVWDVNWDEKLNNYSFLAENLDIVKTEISWKKGLISFKSISPQGELFDVAEFKKSFLNRISLEGHKLLNYGYAQGYKPLIDYLTNYMKNKGATTQNKDILITNGFTEGLDMILSSFTRPGDSILCENPTHNTAIKLMKMYGLNIVGVEIKKDGIDVNDLENRLKENKIKFAYIIPSYHNPTGIVMQPEKRYEVYNIFRKYKVPIIEDGFNEELLYSSSHIPPIAALEGEGSGVIYIGSFSKILFPGIRLGWVFGDRRLINILESVKRARNIHSSFLDQAVFFDYLSSGAFEKYLKKIRKVYKEKFQFALECVNKYIEAVEVYGEGGLHLFIKLKTVNARTLLAQCHAQGVIFTPGDIFYTDSNGSNALRLGFSRLSLEDIESGLRIIGLELEKLQNEKV